jgi:hypothetical protein
MATTKPCSLHHVSGKVGEMELKEKEREKLFFLHSYQDCLIYFHRLILLFANLRHNISTFIE